MTDIDLCFTPATELAARIRADSLSPVTLVSNALSRIAEVNPTLNCFCFVYAEEALNLARQMEAEAKAGHFRGPLHAVPYALKGRRATAESMAQKQRDISVSEFFMKNRHLLGYHSPARALLTTVKEAFDNSLDACEEAGILPTVRVELVEINEERYRVIVEENGPGIVKAQIPKAFGTLLYGSKFHR